jgi:acyl transferase domain-containing protein
MFDAAFFGFNPREAETLDPQHRLFLECGWESLENAGYDPERYPGSIGVYAGTGASGYLLTHLLSSEGRSHPAFTYQTLTANDKDHLATRLS